MSEVNWFADVMGRKRIHIPEIDGWIEVRQEVSAGEEADYFDGVLRGQVSLGDGAMRSEYDMARLSFGTVMMYLVSWSCSTPLPDDPKAKFDLLKAMNKSVFGHIKDAIDAHVEELAKNAPKAGKKRARIAAVSNSPSAVS